MAAFILRRLGQAVLVRLTVGLIAFSLFRFVGDPVLFMLGQDATDEDRARVTRLLGLDRPFYVQYAAFLPSELTPRPQIMSSGPISFPSIHTQH